MAEQFQHHNHAGTHWMGHGNQPVNIFPFIWHYAKVGSSPSDDMSLRGEIMSSLGFSLAGFM